MQQLHKQSSLWQSNVFSKMTMPWSSRIKKEAPGEDSFESPPKELWKSALSIKNHLLHAGPVFVQCPALTGWRGDHRCREGAPGGCVVPSPLRSLDQRR